MTLISISLKRKKIIDFLIDVTLIPLFNLDYLIELFRPLLFIIIILFIFILSSKVRKVFRSGPNYPFSGRLSLKKVKVVQMCSIKIIYKFGWFVSLEGTQE